MFDSITGSFTTYTAAGITSATTLDLGKDELKNWTITIGATEYRITGNENNEIYFANSLSAGASFTVDYSTRADLAKIEDEIASTVKFPNTLVANKIQSTKYHFDQKVRAYFRNLYTSFPDVADPMSLILNLGELKLAFTYYVIAECYSDTTLVNDDMNVYNEDKYRKKYKEIISDALSLLAVDTEQSGELSNNDKGSSRARGVVLDR